MSDNDDLAFETAMRSITIFVTFLFFIFGLLILNYSGNVASIDQTIVHDYLNKAYMEQLINNPSCFAYADETTGRIDLKVIDSNKFTAERLEACTTFGTEAPFTLRPVEASILYHTEKQETTIHTNLWEGKNVQTFRRTFTVYVRNETKITPATLIISMNDRVQKHETTA
jgi:hypothetical protein